MALPAHGRGQLSGIPEERHGQGQEVFYVLRPILACRWILEKRTPPPMLFSELMESQLPDYLGDTVRSLLELKVNSPEVKLIPRIDVLNEYLDRSISEGRKQIERLPKEAAQGWEELDELFLSVLDNSYTSTLPLSHQSD